MKIKRTKYGKALLRAAEEAYQNELIDTETVDNEIGFDNYYDTKEDWIEDKIESWIEGE